jgi:prolyl-tRNA synthetase
VGPKGLAAGTVELKRRSGGAAEAVSADGALSAILG